MKRLLENKCKAVNGLWFNKSKKERPKTPKCLMCDKDIPQPSRRFHYCSPKCAYNARREYYRIWHRQKYFSEKSREKRRAYQIVYLQRPGVRERELTLRKARDAAKALGTSTAAIMEQWGLDPGNASRVPHSAPRDLPKGWKDHVRTA